MLEEIIFKDDKMTNMDTYIAIKRLNNYCRAPPGIGATM